MPRLGVLGWPVAHSRSPAMHNAALAALGMRDWHYQRLPVPPALFAETVRALARSGLPRRERDDPPQGGRARARRRGERAAARGSARRTRSPSPPTGRSRRRTPTPRADRRARHRARGAARAGARRGGQRARGCLGAARGGSGRGVGLEPHAQRARGARRSELGASAVEAASSADLLVNCTSVGLSVERSATEDRGLNQLGMTGDQIGGYSHVVDLVYRSGPTPLLAAADARGARTIDGLEILVAQGALSLELWTGREPPARGHARAAAASDCRNRHRPGGAAMSDAPAGRPGPARDLRHRRRARASASP